ncbi:MAG: hypothetical protein DHS20C13_28090 [Thermodesulfobacteriota bacterium]|nr:MAG: hypothetical protein DHS20C13_28090 [Thermodesulfobacteriota bacterium]
MKDSNFDMATAISVLENKDDSFESLIKVASLNPESDFRYTDLSFVNFGCADLTGYDFTGANLRYANLSRAKIENTMFDYADLLGVQWPPGDKRKVSQLLGYSNQDLFVPDVKKDWRAVDRGVSKYFTSKIVNIDGAFEITERSTRIFERELSFYPGVKLICLQDLEWNIINLRIYFLIYENQEYRLSGSPDPIHLMNSVLPIKIDENNVVDYLRFFCFFVRGEGGPFLVIEDAYDYYLPNDLDELERSEINDVVRPASIESIEREGICICNAIILYSNALFSAIFSISKSGKVVMLDDEPIVANLSIKVDAPLSNNVGSNNSLV